MQSYRFWGVPHFKSNRYLFFNYPAERRTAATYDPFKHQILLASKDHIARFDSQGFQPSSFLRMQLQILEVRPEEGNRLSLDVVR